MSHADVRGINVAVDVEIADVAVALFAHVIGEPADGEQVVRLEEREAIIGGKAITSEDFGRDGFEVRVDDSEFCAQRLELTLSFFCGSRREITKCVADSTQTICIAPGFSFVSGQTTKSANTA